MSTASGNPIITPPPSAQNIGDVQRRIVVALSSGNKYVFTPKDKLSNEDGNEIPFERAVDFLSIQGAVLTQEITGIEIVEDGMPKLASTINHIYQQGIESVSEVFITPAFDSQNAS